MLSQWFDGDHKSTSTGARATNLGDQKGLLDGLLGVAGGGWDDDITSDEMDHSRKFPA